MLNRSSFRSRCWFQVLLLAVATWLAVTAVFGRWSSAEWSVPHWFEGDPLEVYARVQIAAEQPWHALTSFAHPARLGAPFGADWSGYAVPDRLVFLLTGQLSRLVGLIAAVQLVSAFGFVLNATAFFLCARWLRCRWEWAAAFALGFAFCNYNVRWGITLSLAQTFTLPPLVLLCGYAARPAPAALSPRWLALSAALGLWLALGNPYLAFFSGVVGVGGLVLALWRRAPRSRVAPLACFLAVLTLAFVAANVHYALAHWRDDGSGALARDLSDFSRYALRPLEWLVPPGDHRLGAFADLGRAYQTSRGTGEFFYNYLGLLGVAGLFWAIATSARNAVRFPFRQTVLLGLLWIVLFGSPHGFNTWLGALGLDVFRASTRIGIFAAVWVGFFLARRTTQHTRHWPRGASIALAGCTAVFLVWEQTPNLAARAPREANASRARAYRDFGTALERALPASAMIFQLPAAPFPEAGRIAAMPDYEHLIPFLLSTTLRISYGHLSNTPTLRWNRSIAHLPPREMIVELQQAGFAGLWIDRRGVPEDAVSLVRDLRATGLTEITAPQSLPINVFVLRPANPATPPDPTSPFFFDPWALGASDAGAAVRLLAVEGWFSPERDRDRTWRWAGQRAILGLWNAGSDHARVRLTFVPVGRPPDRLSLHNGGRFIWEAAFADASGRPQSIEVVLPPGLNRFDWQLEGKTFVPSPTDRRQLGFAIENVSIEPQ